MKNQKQKEYETPQTTFVEVELEGNFCTSLVDEDKQSKPTVSITNQEVGAESNYFEDGTGWDY